MCTGAMFMLDKTVVEGIVSNSRIRKCAPSTNGYKWELEAPTALMKSGRSESALALPPCAECSGCKYFLIMPLALAADRGRR